MHKKYISPSQLLQDAFQLGWDVYESGFRPDLVSGIWRGGTPVGIAVHELLYILGVKAKHCAIRTASYSGIGQQNREVVVEGLEYLVPRLRDGASLLLVDDVYDTGLSMATVLAQLRAQTGGAGEIRVATPYFKPGNNQTDREPDYYLHSGNDWLVFPHELDGLTTEELVANKPELAAVLPHLAGKLAT